MLNNTTSSCSFMGLLTILFIALKLTNCIAWSWLWVLSPAWGLWCLYFLIIGLEALAILCEKKALELEENVKNSE